MGKGAEYWSRHLAAIEAEGITTKAYAQREGLSVGALYEWRRRLNEERRSLARRRSGCFVPVAVEPADEPMRCRLAIGTVVAVDMPQLPDPRWLAAVFAAVADRGR